MKIELNKKYLTQDGRTVTITAVNEKYSYVIGEFSLGGKVSWDLNGHFGEMYPHMNLVSEVK